MPETDTPETIRSALAYFQRGGLVEMTERTLAEIAAGRKVVECDADGVLALCSLASVAMVARAGRGEGDDDALVEATSSLRDAALIFRCPEGFEALAEALGISDDTEARGKLDAAFKAVARNERLKGGAL